MQDLKILALQSDLHWENPERNRSDFTARIRNSFEDHHLILLPETFTTGFPVDPNSFSEDINGTTVEWMMQISEEYKTVVAGTILIKSDDGYANTLIWMSPGGIFEQYRKRHVFSMGGEHEKISAGTDKLIVNLNGWKIRPMICYDLRFPVWSKNQYDEVQGFEYDIAIYVANWPGVRSYPWKTLLLARAIENQSYVIGLNRVGIDGPGNSYTGDSMIIDPKGAIIKLGTEGVEDELSATLSYSALTDFREKFNVGPDWDRFTIH